VSQPKIPPVQVTKDPEAQVERPKPEMFVPKRLVVEAVVAKREVVVAADEVELTAVKFWRVDDPLALMFANVPRPVEVRSPPLAVV
jgi:hypothetical protein